MANTITIDKFYQPNEDLTPIQIRLFELLRDEGPMHRKQLVSALKTPRTTIYDNLLKLQKKKLIENARDNNGLRGRPLVYWGLKNKGVKL